jgi:hypothetical protein
MLSWLLRNPDFRARLGLTSYGFVAAGAVLLCVTLVRLAGYPWSLDAASSTTLAVTSEAGPYWGVRRFIRVAGRTYACSDGRTRSFDAGLVEVAYDPGRPERCRARAMIGRLGGYEQVPLWAALSWLALGNAAMLGSRAYERRMFDTDGVFVPRVSERALDLLFAAGLGLQALCGVLVLVFQ